LLQAVEPEKSGEDNGVSPWYARINPLRVGLVIIVGILAIYTAILWHRTSRLEQDLLRLQVQNAGFKAQIQEMRTRLQKVERRMPIGAFELAPRTYQPDGRKK
jgi:type II secretory pathway pseudopilin PulG